MVCQSLRDPVLRGALVLNGLNDRALLDPDARRGGLVGCIAYDTID